MLQKEVQEGYCPILAILIGCTEEQAYLSSHPKTKDRGRRPTIRVSLKNQGNGERIQPAIHYRQLELERERERWHASSVEDGSRFRKVSTFMGHLGEVGFWIQGEEAHSSESCFKFFLLL